MSLTAAHCRTAETLRIHRLFFPCALSAAATYEHGFFLAPTPSRLISRVQKGPLPAFEILLTALCLATSVLLSPRLPLSLRTRRSTRRTVSAWRERTGTEQRMYVVEQFAPLLPLPPLQINIQLSSSNFVPATLSSYSHYVFATLDHDDTGVITFEVRTC